MSHYRYFAIDLGQRAAAIAREHFTPDIAATFKSDNSPLTIADTTINTMVIEAVQSTFPGHRVIGEEESSDGDGSEYAWVCDPIDGTIPFSTGYPTFVFSLSLVKDGIPILAVNVDPILERVYCAELGLGATLNDKLITVDSNAMFERNNVAIEGVRHHARVDELRYKMSELGATWSRVHSCLYGGSLVAAGRFGAMVLGGTNPWDAASIALLVPEAGGIVTDLDGRQQRYDEPVNGLVAAASPEIHTRLIEMLAANGH